jgi:hypothetical protein
MGRKKTGRVLSLSVCSVVVIAMLLVMTGTAMASRGPSAGSAKWDFDDRISQDNGETPVGGSTMPLDGLRFVYVLGALGIMALVGGAALWRRLTVSR